MKKIIFTLIAVFASISAIAQTSLKYNGKFELAGMAVSNKDASGTGIAFHTIHGVDIKSKAFIGLGTGIDYSFSVEDVFIPAFLQGDIMIYDKTDLKPFASLRIGGLFCTSRSSNIFNFNPSIGIRYSKFALTVGYIHQYGVDKDDMSSPMGGQAQTVKSKYSYDGVTVGLIFSIH
jgi:hypothetical protein